MLTRTNYQIYAWTILIVFLLAGIFAIPVGARMSAPQQADNSCLTCHEDLYYLHDTGCWYCMSDAHKDRCTDCHEGNSASYTEKEAHLDMLIHPQQNDGAKCLECHTPEEAQVRMAKFESVQAFDTVISAKAYTPSQPAKLGLVETENTNPFKANFGWLTFGIFGFGIWLALVLKG
ncbi:MAG: hypothetical protein H6635_00855 [Anaerolineales bacterium]|nr:hypothetical protein [Anaerolineales bacterium]MCB9143891.1 hypothetical protein [Anaerolineales bacterium]